MTRAPNGPAVTRMGARRTTLGRTTNIAVNPAIRATNRIASRGRRGAHGAKARMSRGGVVTTIVRGVMTAAAVAGAGCTRVPAEPVGAVRALSVSGR